mmetsp:Transcript_26266/g.53309  ORF Transcript_26266/g.53309 Transcript_26266/m.53309 type:complete len:92 (+) Transcript_26266:523-798(+)
MDLSSTDVFRATILRRLILLLLGIVPPFYVILLESSSFICVDGLVVHRCFLKPSSRDDSTTSIMYRWTLHLLVGYYFQLVMPLCLRSCGIK